MNPFGVMLLSKKSTRFVPVWHLAIEWCNPAFWMLLKTAFKILISCWSESAAMSMWTTNCAHWSALMTGCNYSWIKFQNADIEQLKLCASLRYSKFLLPKLNASISTGRWSAICKQWYVWEQSSLQKKFFLPCVVQRLSLCWLGGCFFM